MNVNTQKGSALIISIFFFLAISSVMVIGVSSSVFSDSRSVRFARESRESFFTSESGIEDVIHRFQSGMNTETENLLSLNNTVATTTVTDLGGSTYEINTEASTVSSARNTLANISVGSGTSFYYGIQIGTGGLTLRETSSVTGNVYSNRLITGYSSNTITGSAVAAGSSGRISGVSVGVDAFANRIQNSSVTGDAYYQTISGTTVGGTSYPSSPDQPETGFPIASSTIETWKDEAEAGGTISTPCPYIITTTQIIGPVKITCDLTIRNAANVTLEGPIWVEGDIEIRDTASIQVDPLLGGQSVPIIADDESDRINSGTITLRNSATFSGSGTEGSYVLLVSNNEASSQNQHTTAIVVRDSASGEALLYSNLGSVALYESTSFNSVTGHRVQLRNSANIVYETGLTSLLFSSGPGGGYAISEWSLVE